MRNYHAIAALGLIALAVGGCQSVAGGPSAADQTALVSCQGIALALSPLASARASGLLTPSDIARADADFKIVDPICLGKSDSILAGAAGAAAAEIIQLATKGK